MTLRPTKVQDCPSPGTKLSSFWHTWASSPETSPVSVFSLLLSVCCPKGASSPSSLLSKGRMLSSMVKSEVKAASRKGFIRSTLNGNASSPINTYGRLLVVFGMVSFPAIFRLFCSFSKNLGFCNTLSDALPFVPKSHIKIR
nr:unnamed protein product [Callosobruchus analis]